MVKRSAALIVSSASEPAEIVSLSNPQVMTLLRTIRQHRALLTAAHEDAHRLALETRRPGYVVDFELLYRYMFRGDERPDWEQELQYLFDLPETTFLIGPGTSLEIARLVHHADFVHDAEGKLQDLLVGSGATRQSFGLDEETIRHGMDRLHRLLDSPNFRHYTDLVVPVQVDREAFETAIAALGRKRRNASAEANRADAMNWAAVIHLRTLADELQLTFHPYLLTATRPLLDERSWSAETDGPVSRKPSEAIYTEILFETYPDPVSSQQHTVEMSLTAALLEHDLHMTPAYQSPGNFQNEPQWERALTNNLVGDALREQLSRLTAFVTDPIVVETQRIYDNAHFASVSMKQQRGFDTVSEQSPRRLFDLIVGVNSALHADRHAPGLDALWSTALSLEAEHHEDRVTRHLIDIGSRRRPYLVVEDYASAREGKSGGYVLRWPCSVAATDLMRLFSRAYARHNVSQVNMTVGMRTSVEELRAEVPFELAEIVAAVGGSDDSDGPADGNIGEVLWIRISADDFDLYADLMPPDPKQDPVVGLFVDRLDPTHIVDLYMRTSARYLFSGWLRAALKAIADSDSTAAR